jgi:hypothetical protein
MIGSGAEGATRLFARGVNGRRVGRASQFRRCQHRGRTARQQEAAAVLFMSPERCQFVRRGVALSRQERARGMKEGANIGDTSDRNLVALLRNHHRRFAITMRTLCCALCFAVECLERYVDRFLPRSFGFVLK